MSRFNIKKLIRNAVRLAATTAFACPALGFASVNSGVTYHGRILSSDGVTPVTDSSVQFKMEIHTPDNQSCLMYAETQTKDLSSTLGAFSITINDGSGSRLDTTGLTLDEVFANHGTFSFDSSTCANGSGTDNYTPSPSDGRSFVVSFKIGVSGTWEPLPAQAINFAPMAIEARQVSGFPATSLLRVEDSNVPQAVSSFTSSDFTALQALIAGTSTQYMQTTSNGAPLPSFSTDPFAPPAGDIWYDSTNKVVKFSDGSGTAVTIGSGGGGGGSGTVTSVGLSMPSIFSVTNSPVTTSGVLTTSLATQAANTIFAGPSSGGAAPPTFRTLTSADLPIGAYDSSYFKNGGNAFAGAATLGTTDSNTLAFETAGVTAMTIDASGNVGIGTTTPGHSLTVNSSSTDPSTTTVATSITQKNSYTTTSGVDGQGANVQVHPNFPVSISGSGATFTGVYGTSTVFTGEGGGTVGALIGVRAKYGIETGGAGAVTNAYGIYVSPNHAAGTITNSYAMYLANASTGGTVTNYYGLYQVDSTATNYFAGNVGIGTTSPSSNLHINVASTGSAVAQITVGIAGVGAGIMKLDEATGTTHFASSSHPDSIVVQNANGRIGIGTASPQSALHVYGNGPTLELQDSSASGSAAASLVAFYGADGSREGYVGDFSGANENIGMHSDNGSIVVSSGGNICTYTSGASWSCSSDERLKQNIKPLSNSLDKVLKLRGVSYHWRDPKKSKEEHIGLIAQEVEKVYPQMVSTSEDNGYKTVDYSAFISPLIESTKSLYGMCRANDRHLASVDQKITALKSENAKLKSENEKIKRYLCGKDPAAPFCH